MEEYIKEIHIVFENCEVIRIPHEALYHVSMSTARKVYANECQTEIANHVSLSIDTSRVKEDDSSAHKWTTRKDITHIHIYYQSGNDRYVEVAYPCYFCYWYRNPYQDNYFWERETETGNVQMLDIDIEPYWSLLSIKQSIKDTLTFWYKQTRNAFGGYWATFKRHFKWRH